MNTQQQEFEKIQQLATKNSWLTGLLTFFLLPVGYIYTGRYKAMFIGFGIMVGFTALCIAGDPSLENDDDFSTGVGFLYMIGATIDNTSAVNQAKKRLKNFQTLDNNYQHLPQQSAPNLKITLLRFAKQQGEVTVADCVIETGQDAQQIRDILRQLINEDLLTTGNRDSDGAVVYRVI
jgi:hypothetical protein